MAQVSEVTRSASVLVTTLGCAMLLAGTCLGGHPLRYWMMRLFLANRAEGTIFSTLPQRQSRQEYIQQVFSVEARFQHWQRTYVYKPFPKPDDVHVVGVLAREHSVVVSGPPEEQFAPQEVADWETANVVIDPSDGDEGQKVAMQHNVGQPVAILRSFVDHINAAHPSAEWAISVNPITTQEQFWGVAERYQGHIEEIDLSFAVPNIWDGQSETEKALRELKEKNNAQEVDVKIKNKDGRLIPDTKRIRDSVDYITRGGGTARIRDDTQTVVYSSDQEESIVTKLVEPDPPIQEADIEAVRHIVRRLFGI